MIRITTTTRMNTCDWRQNSSDQCNVSQFFPHINCHTLLFFLIRLHLNFSGSLVFSGFFFTFLGYHCKFLHCILKLHRIVKSGFLIFHTTTTTTRHREKHRTDQSNDSDFFPHNNLHFRFPMDAIYHRKRTCQGVFCFSAGVAGVCFC